MPDRWTQDRPLFLLRLRQCCGEGPLEREMATQSDHHYTSNYTNNEIEASLCASATYTDLTTPFIYVHVTFPHLRQNDVIHSNMTSPNVVASQDVRNGRQS